MAWIKIIDEENAEDSLKEQYDQLIEPWGGVDNILKIHSLNPESLAAHVKLYKTLMYGKSPLRRTEREMIAVVVSSLNKCFYCQVAHGASVRELSSNPELSEELIMNYNIANITEKDKMMLQFSEKLTLYSHKIEDDDRNVLRKAGFSDEDIWDIISVVGFFNMSNRIASGTKMIPNKEYHSAGR